VVKISKITAVYRKNYDWITALTVRSYLPPIKVIIWLQKYYETELCHGGVDQNEINKRKKLSNTE